MSEGQITLCNSCKGELPSEAVKCAQCGSFQDWRRYLTFSATVLSLLVALTSMIALIVTQIKSAIPPDSRVEAFVVNQPYLTTVFDKKPLLDLARKYNGLRDEKAQLRETTGDPESNRKRIEEIEAELKEVAQRLRAFSRESAADSKARRSRKKRSSTASGDVDLPRELLRGIDSRGLAIPHLAIEIMAVNTGTRPALIEGFQIRLNDQKEWQKASLYVESGTTDFFDRSEILGPGDTAHFAAKIPAQEVPKEFEIQATIVNFRGKRTQAKVVSPH